MTNFEAEYTINMYSGPDRTRRAAVDGHVSACCDLDPKSNQHIYELKYICDQNWVKFSSLVSETWCSQAFCVIVHKAFHADAESLAADSQTDTAENTIPLVPVFGGAWGHKDKNTL